MDESEEEVEPEEPETNPQFEELVDISKYSPTKPPLGQAKVKSTKLFFTFFERLEFYSQKYSWLNNLDRHSSSQPCIDL